MAITNYLVHFLTEDTYTSKKSELRNDAVAFVKDATIIHTHGTDYYCGSGPVALKSELSNYATTSALTSGLAGKANVSHTHTISQISGLQTELDSKLESVSLADLGITATAAELNYVDGVTSNIQTQLNGKAASSHNHSAANITSGTLDLARIPSITDAKITSVSASKITGTIPQANLPSYVDDVLEYSSKSSFPKTGEAGKIYVDTTTNLTYRWGGSSYVEISPSLALGETSSTAFRGDRGKIAYDHSQATGNPHNLTLSNLGISATAAEINKLDGLTASTAELNFVDGVTSNIQTQLNGKANASALAAYLPLSGGTMTGDIIIPSARATTDLPTVPAAMAFNSMESLTDVENYRSFIGSAYVGDTWYSVISARHRNGCSDGNKYGLYLTSMFDLTGGLTWRKQYNGDWGDVLTLLDSSNYTSYTVTKTGGGASGTWNINISGAAASANSVAWNNISGKPSTFTPATHTHSQYLTSSSLSGYATQSWVNSQGFIKSATDTKNTTGTFNSLSKLYLVGGTSQSSAGVVTYSNNQVYTQLGQLYASQMNATNGFFETSDARLKDFKEDIKALDTVDQIPTKYFTWKEDESKDSQIGTSAQEVEKLYPELVSKTEDNTLTVDYAKLSIIALAAIKELKAEIQSLKEEIKQLKSK